MKKRFIVTGTDTNVGKTVFCSALMLGLKDAYYWKPLQSGNLEIDKDYIKTVTGLPSNRFFPEAYVFSEPLSPHRAAEIEGIALDLDLLDSSRVPNPQGMLIIEGAGGLMVPITRDCLQIDLFEKWNLPVVLVARTSLGTINHTLLSLEALRKRGITVLGLAFIGDDNEDNILTISQFSGTKVLGRLPWIKTLNAENLSTSFNQNFSIRDFYE